MVEKLAWQVKLIAQMPFSTKLAVKRIFSLFAKQKDPVAAVLAYVENKNEIPAAAFVACARILKDYGGEREIARLLAMYESESSNKVKIYILRILLQIDSKEYTPMLDSIIRNSYDSAFFVAAELIKENCIVESLGELVKRGLVFFSPFEKARLINSQNISSHYQYLIAIASAIRTLVQHARFSQDTYKSAMDFLQACLQDSFSGESLDEEVVLAYMFIYRMSTDPNFRKQIKDQLMSELRSRSSLRLASLRSNEKLLSLSLLSAPILPKLAAYGVNCSLGWPFTFGSLWRMFRF